MVNTLTIHLLLHLQLQSKFALYEKRNTKILLVDDEPDILEIGL
jgi:hypothetical protein